MSGPAASVRRAQAAGASHGTAHGTALKVLLVGDQVFYIILPHPLDPRDQVAS